MPVIGIRMSVRKLRSRQIDFSNGLFYLMKDVFLDHLNSKNFYEKNMRVEIPHEDLVIQLYLENTDETVLKEDFNFINEFIKRLIYHKLF